MAASASASDRLIGPDFAVYINQLIVAANTAFAISPAIPVVTVPVSLADFNHAMNRHFIRPFNAAVPQSTVAYVRGPNAVIANYTYNNVVQAVNATPPPPPVRPPPPPAPLATQEAPPPSPPSPPARSSAPAPPPGRK